jgi:hypothetical protein
VLGELTRSEHKSGNSQSGKQGRRNVETRPRHRDRGPQVVERVVQRGPHLELRRRPGRERRTAEHGQRNVTATERVGTPLQRPDIAEPQPTGIRYSQPQRIGVLGQIRRRRQCLTRHQRHRFGRSEGGTQARPDRRAAAVRPVQPGHSHPDLPPAIGLYPQFIPGPHRELRGKHLTQRGLDQPTTTAVCPRPAPRHQVGMPLRVLEGDESDGSVVAPVAVRLGHTECGGPAGRDP